MPKEPTAGEQNRSSHIKVLGAGIAKEILIRHGNKFANYGKFKANDNIDQVVEWILGYSEYAATKIIDHYEFKDETN